MGGAARPPSFIPSVTPVWPVQNRDNLPQNDGANDEEDNETVSSNVICYFILCCGKFTF